MSVTERHNIKNADTPDQIINEDLLLGFVKSAIRAPSGHNTQPWLFQLNENAIDVFADRTRALPVVDPYDRELTISCGAAIRFLELAARQFGLDAVIALLPDGDRADRLARVEFRQGRPVSKSEAALFEAIKTRRTNRGVFKPDLIPDDIQKNCGERVKKFGVDAVWVSSIDKRSTIAELVSEGDHMQFEDPSFRRELASWVHSYRRGSKDGMSGAAFDMPDLLAPVARFAIRNIDLGDSVGAANFEKIKTGAPALLTLCSEGDEVIQWINTGRALAELLLYLTAEGYAHSYLNQPIETAPLRPRLKRTLGSDALPQILLRVGRPTKPVPATVRRDVSSVILPSSR